METNIGDQKAFDDLNEDTPISLVQEAFNIGWRKAVAICITRGIGSWNSDRETAWRQAREELASLAPAEQGEVERLRDAAADLRTWLSVHGVKLDDDAMTAINQAFLALSRPSSEALPAGEGARYLIRKGGSFYRPNAQGYTNDRAQAGRYTLEEAVLHTHPNGANGPRDGLSYILDATSPQAPASEKSGRE